MPHHIVIPPLTQDKPNIKKRQSEQAIFNVLNDIASGMTAVEAARRHGVHPNTVGVWKKRFRGMRTDDISYIRTIEQENARLKREIERLTSENDAMSDILRKNFSGPQRARTAARALRERGLSERRACELAHFARSTLRYEGPRA